MTHTPSSSLGTDDILALWRAAQRPMMVGALVGVALAVAFVLVRGPRYTATGAFVPERQGGSLGAFAGLASQIGLPIPTDDAGNSPEFYAALVRSPEILLPLMDDTLGASATTLRAHYEVTDDDAAVARARALRQFRRELIVRTDARSGLVTVAVRTSDPTVAAAATARLLERVNTFNAASRRTRAREERVFLEQRLAQVRDELETVERSKQRFLDANRDYSNSPALRFELDKLDREVARRNQVYTGVAEALERARISEVRDTPVITVSERPVAPALPDPRGLTLRALLAAIGGAGLALVVVAVRRGMS